MSDVKISALPVGVAASSTPFPAVVGGVTAQVTLAPVYTALAGKTALVHTHAAADVTSGVFAQARIPPTANAVVVFNVKDYGALGDGATDDTTAIQAAIDAAKAVHGTVYAPVGNYPISRLNLTGISGMRFMGDGAQVNGTIFSPIAGTASYGTATGHVFDCTGSALITFANFQVGAFNQTAVPTTCFFLAQVASGVSNAFHFDSVYATGKYTSAALYITRVPSCDAINSDFYNYTTGAGAHAPIKMTQSNVDSLTSSFATVNLASVTANWTFTACEFHKFAGAGANNHVIYLDGVKDLVFTQGVVSGGATTYVGGANEVKRVLFTGTTFETESEPVTPTNLFIPGTDNSAVRFDGCLAILTGSTFFGGSGSYNSLSAAADRFLGHVTASGTFPAASTLYLSPAGTEGGEINARQIVTANGVLTGLRVSQQAAPVGAETVTVTVMVNGVASALTCQFTGAATGATDLSHFVNVSAGDSVSFRWVTSAGAAVVPGQYAGCSFQPCPELVF